MEGTAVVCVKAKGLSALYRKTGSGACSLNIVGEDLGKPHVREQYQGY